MPTKKKATDEVKIVNSEQAEQMDPELAPAGFKRDEQLAERKDQLEQAAEEASDQREIYSFDPSKFEPDREIQKLLDELHVDGGLPDRKYFWCYEGQNGYFIRSAMRLGWIVVKAEDTECPELKDARGYRKLGDTILMWTSVANYDKIQAMREYRQLLHEKGVGAALKELGDRYRSKGFIIHDDAEEKRLGPQGNQTLMDTMRKRAANQAATTGVNTMLRNGTVPGMSAGRRR